MKDQKTAQKKNARKCTNPVPDFCGTQQNDLPIHGNSQSSPMDRARNQREGRPSESSGRSSLMNLRVS